jgi:hypothetical protein
MSIESVCVRTESGSPDAIVSEIGARFGKDPMALTLFFATPDLDFQRIASLLDERVGGPTIGCTTAGELCGSEGHCEGGVVAMGIRSSCLEARVRLIEQASAFSAVRADRELEGFASTGSDEAGADAFGLVLVDGLSRGEERVAGALSHVFKDIPFAGGSAGDNLGFRRTLVACNGRVASDAAVVTLVRTTLPFRIFHAHHFARTDRTLVITGAVPEERRVTEINGQPAAEGYAEAIGLPVERLSPEVFAAHPVLLTIGGAPFVRSIQKMEADGSLVFYCAIEEGLVLRIAEATELAPALERQFDEIRDAFDPAAVIAFDCVLRRLEILGTGQRERVRSLISGLPIIGFSTYGEQYNGLHVNQTLTGVAIGRAA